mgnify:CR=1 FL=1
MITKIVKTHKEKKKTIVTCRYYLLNVLLLYQIKVITHNPTHSEGYLHPHSKPHLEQ